MATNRAAWIQSKQARPFVVADAPMPPSPPPGFLTIQVHAVAINPADVGIQTMGVLVDTYPSILGIDASGIVTAVGPSVSDFKVGDRVTGLADHFEETAGHGVFALYCNLRHDLVAKIPDTTEFRDACVLPCAIMTAAYSLFEKEGLGFGFPGSGEGKGKVVLIWGGSSSVGSCAIQLAKAAGYTVATTAGSKNLEYCKQLGAEYAFDYKKEGVVEDIVEALKGKDFVGAFSTMLYPETYITCAEIVHKIGGVQKVASVIPHMMPKDDLPHGVAFGHCNCFHIRHSDVGPAILGKYIPQALADGSLKCKPDAEVVGHGLEFCQEAVDRNAAGASAQKFVVTFV